MKIQWARIVVCTLRRFLAGAFRRCAYPLAQTAWNSCFPGTRRRDLTRRKRTAGDPALAG